jgi:hypothetical protein
MRFLLVILAIAASSGGRLLEEQMPLQEADNVDNSTVDATAITGVPEHGWVCSNSKFIYTKKDVELAISAAMKIASGRQGRKCISGQPGTWSRTTSIATLELTISLGADYPKYFGNKENIALSCRDPGKVGYCEFPMDHNRHWENGQRAREDRAVFTIDKNDAT